MSKKREVSKIAYRLFGPHLEPNEEVLRIAHRHPFIIFKNGWKLLLLGFILPMAILRVFPEVWFVGLIWLLVASLKLYKLIFNYYFDAVLITKKSLIDVKWDGPFKRTAVRLDYANVEGITTSTPGFLHTLFNYGTVQINRMGGSVGIELQDAMRPSEIESEILTLQERFIKEKNLSEIKSLKNLLSSMLTKHAQEIEVEF